MARRSSHKWAFKAGTRAGLLGWRGSAKAIDRLNLAKSEISAVNKADPATAAEGVVVLTERIWPALEQIDTSSGALGNAVRRTPEDLVPVLIEAPADEPIRAHFLERLLQAILDKWRRLPRADFQPLRRSRGFALADSPARRP